CAAVFAWNGLLRVMEYCGGALKLKDVTLCPLGVQLRVMFSKTNLRPVTVCMVVRGDSLCPVRALKAYLPFISHLKSNDAFFQFGKRPMSRDDFVGTV